MRGIHRAVTQSGVILTAKSRRMDSTDKPWNDGQRIDAYALRRFRPLAK